MMFMGLLNYIATNPFIISNSPTKFLVGFWSLVFIRASESDKNTFLNGSYKPAVRD